MLIPIVTGDRNYHPDVATSGIDLTDATLDQARTVRFGTQKGGSGRTTTLTNAAYEAARLGARVLLVDADPNRVLTAWKLGYDPDEAGDATISDLVRTTTAGAAGDMILEAPPAWQPRHDLPYDNGGAAPGSEGAIGFIPGSPSLGGEVDNLVSQKASERRFTKALSGVAQHFDLVLIDTGATSDRLSWMTIHASAHVVSVIQPVDDSIGGMLDEIQLVNEVADSFEVPARYRGAIFARYEANSPVESNAGMRAGRVEMEARAAEGRELEPLITLPGPVPGAPEWVTGPVMWPDVVAKRSQVVKASRNREPLALVLAPSGSGQAFHQQQAAAKIQPTIDSYARIAVRMLQLTDAPVLPAVGEYLAATKPNLFMAAQPGDESA